MKPDLPELDTENAVEECKAYYLEIIKLLKEKSSALVAVACVMVAGDVLVHQARNDDEFNAALVMQRLIEILMEPYEAYLEEINENGES